MTSGPEIQVATGRALAGWFASLESLAAGPFRSRVLGLEPPRASPAVFVWAHPDQPTAAAGRSTEGKASALRTPTPMDASSGPSAPCH